MKKAQSQQTFLSIILILLTANSIISRNPRRPEDKTIPVITVSSTDPEYAQTWASLKSSYDPRKTEYSLKHRSLRFKPIKHGFNQQYFDDHKLPDKIITFRNGSGTVLGTTLSNLAQELLEEIKVGQTKLTHFTILKDKDFN